MPSIGIIGYGKMGKDIFSVCLAQPELTNITVYCRHDGDAHTEKMKKELSKSLRRKKLTEEQFNAKSENVRFTDDLADLKDCDIVIESVSENMDIKKDIFAKLDTIVKPECILATNTSSLSIADVFSGNSDLSRCTGLHFFYPVKFTAFAELNVLPETSEETADSLRSFLGMIGKRSITFSGCYHIYLNQIINAAISCGMVLRRENKLSVVAIRDIMSELFPMHSLFGMVDSIGLDLLAGTTMANSCTRIDHISDLGTAEMRGWLAQGVSGASGCFFDTLDDTEFPEKEVSENEKAEIILGMAAFIVNEAVCAANEYGGDRAALIDAVQDAVGLADPLSSYYEKYGYEKINGALTAMLEKTGISSFKPAEKAMYESCFK